MVQRFGVEGMVFHEAKTCPANSNSRYGLPGRLAANLGVPTVVIHGDLNDLRLFSEDQTLTSLEALLEQMAMAPAR
jgi:benzoyl-CoA reductase/2-hydroxyglutaryl-CoA dehydratase subunit BcrC/BadD/HgdB